jgi:hypothetical protein
LNYLKDIFELKYRKRLWIGILTFFKVDLADLKLKQQIRFEYFDPIEQFLNLFIKGRKSILAKISYKIYPGILKQVLFENNLVSDWEFIFEDFQYAIEKIKHLNYITILDIYPNLTMKRRELLDKLVWIKYLKKHKIERNDLINLKFPSLNFIL